MAEVSSVGLARLASYNLEQASPDLLRAMVKAFAGALTGAEADAACRVHAPAACAHAFTCVQARPGPW